MTTPLSLTAPVAIVGAGPAGLMAAERLSAAGVAVHVFDAMPSVGRKFLLAGIGGLNLTHAEPFERFVTRYGERAEACASWLRAFDAAAIRDWAKGLGIETFVGTSQRVFPTDMKAAPLLRAWLHRLRHPAHGAPVSFHMRHRWNGQLHRREDDPAPWQLRFDTPQGECTVHASAVVLALGGASWPRLGSDGSWQSWLAQQQVDIAPLTAANCGFEVTVQDRPGWSEFLATRFAGQPLKSVGLSFTDAKGRQFERKGEFVITSNGVEGSLIYAASAGLRDTIAQTGRVTVQLNLRPELSADKVLAAVAHPRGSRSLSSHLKSRLNLSSLQIALLHELLAPQTLQDPTALARAIQALPLTLTAPSPLAEAISTAGGVRLEGLTLDLMAQALPGVFMAGEMLDWEAPTGGYLLSACLASGRVAAQGVLRWVQSLPV